MPSEKAESTFCPFIKGKCKRHACMFWQHLKGHDPQDKDNYVDRWDCTFRWQVLATLEVAKRAEGGLTGLQAAVEMTRNAIAGVSAHPTVVFRDLPPPSNPIKTLE